MVKVENSALPKERSGLPCQHLEVIYVIPDRNGFPQGASRLYLTVSIRLDTPERRTILSRVGASVQIVLRDLETEFYHVSNHSINVLI